jgi:hypothetical protein
VPDRISFELIAFFDLFPFYPFATALSKAWSCPKIIPDSEVIGFPWNSYGNGGGFHPACLLNGRQHGCGHDLQQQVAILLGDVDVNKNPEDAIILLDACLT